MNVLAIPKRSIVFMLVFLVAVFLMASVALARTVYHGYDKSYTTYYSHYAWICDRERDASLAYTHYQVGSGRYKKVFDGDGAYGYCYNGPYHKRILKHRACETNGPFPNTCGR